MSLSNISSGLVRTSGAAQGVSNIVQGVGQTLGSLTSGTYWEQLRPASFRGIPFGVFGSQVRFGRRNAEHDYPKRDIVWIEDMGRAARKIRLTGFLVGDDVIAQRDRLIAACEAPGNGELIHPTLGRLVVSLMEADSEERWDNGRVFEISFYFVEQGKRVFPSASTSTFDAVMSAATGADAGAISDFVTQASSALSHGSAVLSQAVTTTANWASVASSAVTNATSLFSLVQSIPAAVGQLGRFGGQQGSFTSANQQYLAPGFAATTQGLVAQAAASRQATTSSLAILTTASSAISAATAASYASQAQSANAAVLAAVPTPAEAIQTMKNMATFTPTDPVPASIIGTAMNSMQGAVGDLMRRAAVVSMARASASYQPTSRSDASSIMATISSSLDAEILIAGDQGQDATYSGLRALRAAVVQDLTTRGAQIPSMMTISMNASMPALVLAQRLYRNYARAGELVMEGNPIHPAFMPRSFDVLSS